MNIIWSFEADRVIGKNDSGRIIVNCTSECSLGLRLVYTLNSNASLSDFFILLATTLLKPWCSQTTSP